MNYIKKYFDYDAPERSGGVNEIPKTGISVDNFYEFITQRMSAEEALKKLLAGSIISYEKLKFDQDKSVHPELLCAMVAMDLGWDIRVESKHPHVRGLSIGTEEYMNDNFPEGSKAPIQETPTETLVGTLTKPFGIKGYDSAQIGHPVYETADRYVIYLEPGHHQVPFYKETLGPHIKFEKP